jgi:3-hydroxybutyryl-CoA dehydratase
MNSYTFNDLYVGLSSSFNIKIDLNISKNFINICKDTNPLHVDSEYAKNKGFKDKLIHGMLTSSFYSTLVGMYLPGKYSILHSIKINFSKPVYINELLNVYGEIVFINKAYKQIEMKAYIKNDKEKISKAIIKIGLLHD